MDCLRRSNQSSSHSSIGAGSPSDRNVSKLSGCSRLAMGKERRKNPCRSRRCGQPDEDDMASPLQPNIAIRELQPYIGISENVGSGPLGVAP
ncbi:hypothetical protein NHQ30_000951 [Ciborinia camelliae]|nr:hypothetical protein NHQ30_000951 [Ciborinia camelliae]